MGKEAPAQDDARGTSPTAGGPSVPGRSNDPGFVLAGGFAAPGSFDRAFRREVAAKIRDVLVKAYSTQREFVAEEARRRNLSVEQLLAAYLARVIMEKVDREYL